MTRTSSSSLRRLFPLLVVESRNSSWSARVLIPAQGMASKSNSEKRTLQLTSCLPESATLSIQLSAL